VAAALGALAAALSATLCAGCQPDFGVRASSVGSLRVLAVSADPPEAAPGAAVSYTALVVDGAGQRDDAPVDWAYCKKQKALAELDDADPLCFVFTADYLVPLGTGTTVTGKLPSDACNLFGPDVPPALAGSPPGRPVDPDATGGFYQPLRLILPDPTDAMFPAVLGLGESRVVCGVAGATAEALKELAASYRLNQRPTLTGVSAVGAASIALAPDDGEGAGLVVKAGSRTTLRAAWPACGPDAACGGAETYARYEPATGTIAHPRERLTVSWFATAGAFTFDSISAASADDVSVDDAWTAPSTAGRVRLWAVLRDDRGGVSWERYAVDVQ
jgi:hypothetical protein